MVCNSLRASEPSQSGCCEAIPRFRYNFIKKYVDTRHMSRYDIYRKAT